MNLLVGEMVGGFASGPGGPRGEWLRTGFWGMDLRSGVVGSFQLGLLSLS